MWQDIYIIKWFMAFQMSLVCGWKNDTWLMAFSHRFFRAYSINEYNISQFMTFQMVVVCEWKGAMYLLNVALFHPYMFWSNMRDNILLIIYLLSMQEDIYTIKWLMGSWPFRWFFCLDSRMILGYNTGKKIIIQPKAGCMHSGWGACMVSYA